MAFYVREQNVLQLTLVAATGYERAYIPRFVTVPCTRLRQWLRQGVIEFSRVLVLLLDSHAPGDRLEILRPDCRTLTYRLLVSPDRCRKSANSRDRGPARWSISAPTGDRPKANGAYEQDSRRDKFKGRTIGPRAKLSKKAISPT